MGFSSRVWHGASSWHSPVGSMLVWVVQERVPAPSRGVQWRSLRSVGASIGDPFEGAGRVVEVLFWQIAHRPLKTGLLGRQRSFLFMDVTHGAMSATCKHGDSSKWDWSILPLSSWPVKRPLHWVHTPFYRKSQVFTSLQVTATSAGLSHRKSLRPLRLALRATWFPRRPRVPRTCSRSTCSHSAPRCSEPGRWSLGNPWRQHWLGHVFFRYEASDQC